MRFKYLSLVYCCWLGFSYVGGGPQMLKLGLGAEASLEAVCCGGMYMTVMTK